MEFASLVSLGGDLLEGAGVLAIVAGTGLEKATRPDP